MSLHALSNTITYILGLLGLYGIFDLDILVFQPIDMIAFLILGAIAFYFVILYMVDAYKKIVKRKTD